MFSNVLNVYCAMCGNVCIFYVYVYFTALDGDSQDEDALPVPRVMQWLTGQAQRDEPLK